MARAGAPHGVLQVDSREPRQATNDDTAFLTNYAYFLAAAVDRLRAVEEVRASEQRFRLLVQSVVDYAIFMLHPDGSVVNWSAGAQRIKGYTVDEIVGRDFSVFYTEEDRRAGASIALIPSTKCWRHFGPERRPRPKYPANVNRHPTRTPLKSVLLD